MASAATEQFATKHTTVLRIIVANRGENMLISSSLSEESRSAATSIFSEEKSITFFRGEVIVGRADRCFLRTFALAKTLA